MGHGTCRTEQNCGCKQCGNSVQRDSKTKLPVVAISRELCKVVCTRKPIVLQHSLQNLNWYEAHVWTISTGGDVRKLYAWLVAEFCTAGHSLQNVHWNLSQVCTPTVWWRIGCRVQEMTLGRGNWMHRIGVSTLMCKPCLPNFARDRRVSPYRTRNSWWNIFRRVKVTMEISLA